MGSVNLGQMQQTVTTLINFLFRYFNVLTVNQKHLYEIVKRSFRTILFNLYGILPLTTWRALLLVEETLLSDYFKRECITLRIQKQIRLATVLRKVPGYMYYSTFLRRTRPNPPVMPKESSFFKKIVTSNFTFRLHYKHSISLDKREVRKLRQKYLEKIKKTTEHVFPEKLKNKKNLLKKSSV